jgi:hypothetical protein
VADATGAFSIHYYSVTPYDLGVTFTLTASGRSSQSVAIATFSDGNVSVISSPAGVPSFTNGSYIKYNQSNNCGTGTQSPATFSANPSSATIVVGINNNQSLKLTAPATLPGYAFSSWSIGSPGIHVSGLLTDAAGLCISVPAANDQPLITANYVVSNVEPTVDAGPPYSVAEGTELTLSPTVNDADAGDVLTYKWTVNTSGIDAGGTCSFVDDTAKNAKLTCTDDSQGAPAGKFTLTLEVKDGAGGHTVTDNADLTVTNVAPQATFTTPGSVSLSSSFGISLGSAVEPGANDVGALQYSFDCGGGFDAFNSTPSRTCTATTLPSQTVKGRIRDQDGGENEYTASVAVNNQAPLADAAGDYSTNEGGSGVSISGTGSDPDGGTVTYLWSVAPAGKCSFANATLAATTVTCTDNGTFTLTLKVTDNENAFTTDDATLEVHNVAPTIGSHTLALAPVNEGSSIPFSVGNVTDPSSDDQTAGFTYSFKCGGGVYSAFGASNTVSCDAGDGPGSISISGRAKDKDGGISEAVSSTFTVNNVKPTITAVTTNSPVNEGSNATLTVTTVTDPWAGDLVGAEYAFACDGVTFGAWGSSNTVSCPTTDGPATLTIGAKARDKDDAESDPVTENVTVQNVAPSATFNAPSPVNEGSSFSLSLTGASDPSSVDVTAGFSYAFDCGDGAGYGSFGGSSSTSCSTTDNGSRNVKAKIKDKDDGVREYTGTVTVDNVAPTADFAAQTPVNEGSSFSLTLTNPNDVSSADVTAGFTYAFDCGSGYGAFGASASTSCSTTDNGTRNVGGKIRDKDGGVSTYSGSVTVNNVAPTADLSAQSPVIEGSPFNLALTNPNDVSSADMAAGFTYAFDCGDGSGYGAFGATASVSCPTTDNGSRSVGAKIRDKDGGVTPYTGSVTVTNALPVIGTITGAPLAPIPAGTNVSLNWNFTDPGSDTWTCTIQWDSGESFSSALYTDPKSCSGSKTLAAGLYTVTVKVTDDDGGVGTKTLEAYVVVYDPNGGFVTGGGWIMSPENAYIGDLSLTGKANFGFTSKYQPGKYLPQGNTEFQFHAGNLNFKSTSYEWLVVAGDRAQFKGDGMINGASGYGFLLTGVDGNPDQFRIKIVRKSDGVVVYDNRRGEEEDSSAGTALGGGSIVVHTKK